MHVHSIQSQQEIPRIVLHALFRHPHLLQQVLDTAALSPREVAVWAREEGGKPDIEKLAGWMAVGQHPDHYPSLLEVANSHLRDGELLTALPVLRWAYQVWRNAPERGPRYDAAGVQLLACWGECLYRLGQAEAARLSWLQALNFTRDAATLQSLLQSIERSDASQDLNLILEQAVHRAIPGAAKAQARAEPAPGSTLPAAPPVAAPLKQVPGIAVLADVANLDMVCRDQYGFWARPHYGQLLRTVLVHGPVRVKLAFIPDIPQTVSSQRQLEAQGFTLDLLRPKRSHGRWVANADTAMAAFAVRWAGDAGIHRVELWTGDGDFLRVYDAIRQAWPQVAVVFRSFATGTAVGIQALDKGWIPINEQCVTYVAIH